MLSVTNNENNEYLSQSKHSTKLEGSNKKKGLNVVDVNRVTAETRNEECKKAADNCFEYNCEPELYFPPSDDGKYLVLH